MATADPWAGFKQVPDEDDPWAGFQEVSPAGPSEPVTASPPASAPRLPASSQRQATTWYGSPRNPPRKPAPASTTDDITGAIDGDTLSMGNGKNLRVWGVDAPELKQQGWDRQGRTVPIGQQSLASLNTIMDRARVAAGVPVSSSYGRPVAPVSADGVDLGQALARQGDALAAPGYLANDPERRFQYMQAERLARQNSLGIHDTFHQSPEDFRHNPLPAPDRETVAQFWDTPTPLGGMRPEVEQQYLAMVNDPKVDAAQVVAFARENGFMVDPANIAKVREETRRTGLAAVPNYKGPLRPLTDSGDGATGAAVRGIGSGFLANGLDEIGAFADMAGLTPGRENVWNSDRRLADQWLNNQQQNAAILGFDDTAHPYATTAGKIGGGVASSFIIPYGAGARTIPQLAKVGGVYGGAEGFLGTDGDWSERAIGGVTGVPLGAALNAGGGKALEYGLRFAPRLAERAGLSFPRRAAVDSPAAPVGEFDGIVSHTSEDIAGQAAPRVRDVIDIGDGPVPPPGFRVDNPQPPFPPYRGPMDGGRTRDIIDISDVAAPSRAPMLNRSQAMDGEPGASVTQGIRSPDYLDMTPPRPRPLNDSMRQDQLRAIADDVQPSDVVPIPSNRVGSPEELAAIDAGRFGPARAPNERGQLTKQTIRAWNGAEVPKLGPVDMVGWLRTQGGLRDQGGELRHMGLDNRGRSMDFAGQETRFGPLVNDTDGMNLDDAAMRAWEAGYFPDHLDRPSVNEFLDALRSTHEGRTRNFLPEDLAEIDRYQGAQAERYALEQQRFETGGPVMADRSVPAGEDLPFPPVEAYREWPDGGVDVVGRYVGNIRLDKLETPQDIARALDFTHKQVGGFDPATRGRVSWGETERLAGELGMSPDQLLSRRKGQPFNAEEALAARQILAKSTNELVNAAKRVQQLDTPGDDLMAEFRQKWMRHVAIQEQVAGMTAEAGRALQSFRMAADSRAVRGDVLAALVRGGGGNDNLKDVADTIVDMAETSPGVFNAATRDAGKPGWQKKLSELYINFLLSNPATHVVNMTSNTLTAMAQIPEYGVASAIGKARQLLPNANSDRVIATEVGQRAFGLLRGAKVGAAMFAKALRTGEASDFVSKVEGQEYKAISGLKGEAIRIPTRFLTAEDELFKGVARQVEIGGAAARIAHNEGLRGQALSRRIEELIANPTDDMVREAEESGRYLTFQTKLDPASQDLSNFSNRNIAFKVPLPFVRTPTNLLKFATERSPAAPLLKRWRDDMRAGGARRDVAIARATVGSAFGYAMYEAARFGIVTGSAPTDPKKARLLRAEGWQPYSLKIGDTYYSYKRIDPFSTTLGVAADLATLPEGMSKRQQDDAATLLVASIMGNLASKTWLSGISDVVEALSEPDRYADKMLQRIAASFLIPAGVGGAARAIDPTVRKTDGYDETFRARIPFASQSLLPQRDVWGEKVVREGGVGPDFLSPIYISTAMNDPVTRELMPLDYAPGYPDKKNYTPEQYDRYVEVAGQRSHAALSDLVADKAWKQLDPEDKAKAASDLVSDVRRAVRGELFGNAGAAKDSADPWSDFKQVAGRRKGLEAAPRKDEWAAFKQVEQPDIAGDLQRSIPGVQFTSGFRTPEYQADMRRRGYNPASNSGHLDGSALDMLPPPGKSMSWLREQVQRQHPNARTLIHDGHLHATFPDWFGAPVLGGARSAGLRNPNAPVPPRRPVQR